MPAIYLTMVLADTYIAIIAVQTLVGAPWLWWGYEPEPSLLLALLIFFGAGSIVTGAIGMLGALIFGRRQLT